MRKRSLAIMNRPGKAHSLYLLYFPGHWNSTYNAYNTYNRIYQSRNLFSSLHMARLSMGEENPLPEKKTVAARKRKAMRKSLLDSSGEQESACPSSAQHLGSSNKTIPNIAGDKEAVTPRASDNSAGVQEQVQDVEPGNGTSPKPTGEAEATIPIDSNIDPELQKLATNPTDSKIDPELQKQAAIPIASVSEPELQKQPTIPIASISDPELQKQPTIPIASVSDPELQKQPTIPIASVSEPELQKQPTIPIASVSDPELQKQAQAAEATPEVSGEAEATIPIESELSLETPKSTDYQSAQPSFDDSATAAGSISSPDVQRNDALPCNSHSPTISGQTGEHYVVQQDQEGQNADDLSSENMRPNAQNLRYGGYPTQPTPQHRNTPLGSGRLQNTSKIGGFEILHLVSYNRKADASGLIR